MFNKMKRKQIAAITERGYMGKMDGKKTKNRFSQEVEVQSIEELWRLTLREMTRNGFDIKVVSPDVANAIIRIYSDTNLKHGQTRYWAYGVETFQSTWLGMRTIYRKPINRLECETKIWFNPKEYAVMNPKFKDYYVKII